MGRLTSSIGHITGTPIQDTVDQLINLSAIPRNRLTNRNDGLKRQRSAITDLTVLSVSVQLTARALNSATSFNKTAVSSSNADSVSANRSGTPQIGSYEVRTLQTAGTQAFKSNTFASSTKAFGTNGTLTIRGGGYVDRSTSLSDLNGGRGVQAGSIRITDRSGKSSVIDLSTAASVEDVLRAINEATDINVRATTDGDAIRLIDRTGKTDSNLVVEEVGGGETAADLGLRGTNVAANSATGADVLRLSTETRLATLRDGRGIEFGAGNDLAVTFRDGASLDLDFGDFSREATNAQGSTDTAIANAGLSFSANEVGATGDGVRVRFVDDPSVSPGGETVQRLETPSGPELVFSIDQGTTTAADIVAALEANDELSAAFSALAAGDGSGSVSVDDLTTLSGGAQIEGITDPSIGDMLRVLNEAAPGRLKAELAPGGDSIRLIDLTAGDGEFSVVDVGSSKAAANLGLNGAAVDGVISGTRVLSGLSTVSLDSLAGGRGLGDLGTLNITTADGQTAGIDLSNAASLQDVINSINESGLSVEAPIDRGGAGLQIRDLTGGTSSEFEVSSSDETAQLLGIAGSTTDVLIRGESLELQFVSRSTKLADLNQGRGVGDGSFKITDSLGAVGAINLKTQGITTVGGLVDAINELSTGVVASVNQTGDGIRIVDTAEGAGSLIVEDSGSGTSARQLGLAGLGTKQVVNGEIVTTINGRQVDQFTISAGDNLASLTERIRSEGRFATATLISGASGSAALSITSNRGGSAGRLAVDSDGVNLGLQQTSIGRDAVIAVGGGDGGTPTVLRSADGVFIDAIEGVTLTAKTVSDEPVKLEIKEDRASVESSIKRFVDQYNKLMDRVSELSFFNAADNEVGLMFGRSETLRIQSSLSRAMTMRINSGTSIRTAADVGLKLDATGKLNLDSEKLQAALDASPDDVKDFFTKEIDDVSSEEGKKIKIGFAAKVDEIVERIAGVNNGVLISRTSTLNNQIDRNDLRIQSMNDRLEGERERLLKQFFAMESAIAKLQSNQQYVSQITYFGNPNV